MDERYGREQRSSFLEGKYTVMLVAVYTVKYHRYSTTRNGLNALNAS
jgi:hypothetical protein